MNWDQIQGNWKQWTGKVKEQWGKLTDDELTTIAGQRDQLAGLLQQRYGYAKEQAEKELDEFTNVLKRHTSVETHAVVTEKISLLQPMESHYEIRRWIIRP